MENVETQCIVSLRKLKKNTNSVPILVRCLYFRAMDLETFRNYCLSLPGVTEGFPFGDETLVFKVGEKIFALADAGFFASVNLKCDPEKAIELRERYAAVTPGYHMNKKHWNTVLIDGSISWKMLSEWTKHSYDLVVASLPAKLRMGLR